MRKQRILLKDRVDVAAIWRHRRHINAIQKHPPGCRLFEASNHLQGGGFAAPRRAQHGKKFTVTNRKVGIVHGNEIAVGLLNVVKLDNCSLFVGHLTSFAFHATLVARLAKSQMLMLAITCLTRV